MASLMTIPTEIRLKIWECALPGEVETILQYAVPDGEDDALLWPANPALPLLLTCRKVRDEIMTVSKPILSIVVDDLDMLDALRLVDLSLRKAIGRVRFTGQYIGTSEEEIARWSVSEERRRTFSLRCYYDEVKVVYSTLGGNEQIRGRALFGKNEKAWYVGRNQKAYEVQFAVSVAREPPWKGGLFTNESRRAFWFAGEACTLPRCERLGAARAQLLSLQVKLFQESLESQRLARRLKQDG